MENRSHTNNDDSSKIDISVYTRQIDHLKYMLEMKTDIARLRQENIDRLENQLKDIARHKFIFLS